MEKAKRKGKTRKIEQLEAKLKKLKEADAKAKGEPVEEAPSTMPVSTMPVAEVTSSTSAPPAPVVTPTSTTASTADELKKLAELHKDGVLTDAEFADQKKKLLER